MERDSNNQDEEASELINFTGRENRICRHVIMVI